MLLTGGFALDSSDGAASPAPPTASTCSTAGARIVGRYDKAHLVPYGEYLPMRPLLSAIGLSRLAPGDLDFRAGPGPRTLDLPGFGRVGFQLCYEIIFSGEVVDRANRPDFIFNPSNDAWFGAWGPPQHLAQARLRALEEGLPVIRATPTGICAVIDADGRLLAQPAAGHGRRDRRAPAPRRARRPCSPASATSLAVRLRAAAHRGGDCSRPQSALAGAAHKDIFISAFPVLSQGSSPAMRSNYLFTSESVSEGHPDKVADQISATRSSICSSAKDPEARVACETLVTTKRIVLGRRDPLQGVMDESVGNWAPGVARRDRAGRRATSSSGSATSRTASTGRPADFDNHLHGQSAHIAQGVDASGNKDEGAGDQGIMFGFACDETPDLMPATLYYSATRSSSGMAADRHSGAAPFLEPDAKSQVTLRLRERQAGRARPRSSSRPSTPRAMTRATRKPSCTTM